MVKLDLDKVGAAGAGGGGGGAVNGVLDTDVGVEFFFLSKSGGGAIGRDEFGRIDEVVDNDFIDDIDLTELIGLEILLCNN